LELQKVALALLKNSTQSLSQEDSTKLAIAIKLLTSSGTQNTQTQLQSQLNQISRPIPFVPQQSQTQPLLQFNNPQHQLNPILDTLTNVITQVSIPTTPLDDLSNSNTRSFRNNITTSRQSGPDRFNSNIINNNNNNNNNNNARNSYQRSEINYNSNSRGERVNFSREGRGKGRETDQ